MSLWPLFAHAGAVLLIVVAMLGVSALVGERSRHGEAEEAYESGVAPSGSGRPRMAVGYFRVALLFVLFDLELVFLFAWALVVAEAGWLGFVEMTVFSIVLLVALLYAVRRGALVVGPERGGEP